MPSILTAVTDELCAARWAHCTAVLRLPSLTACSASMSIASGLPASAARTRHSRDAWSSPASLVPGGEQAHGPGLARVCSCHRPLVGVAYVAVCVVRARPGYALLHSGPHPSRFARSPEWSCWRQPRHPCRRRVETPCSAAEQTAAWHAFATRRAPAWPPLVCL